MIYRNLTRTILNSTETTEKTKSPGSPSLAFPLTTAGAFYIGYKEKFTTRYFDLKVFNTVTSVVTVQIWDGTTWVAVEDKVDQTQGFTQSGFISWNIGEVNWQKKAQTPASDIELYWVKITVSVNLSSDTELQGVHNLFCDEALLKLYYPEVVSDTRYIPPNQGDYIPQFLAGKDMVVLRLKQMRAITDESEVLDINEVAVAAVHAAVYILFSPLPDESSRERADDALEKLNNELKLARHSFDTDNSGEIEEEEEFIGTTVLVRR